MCGVVWSVIVWCGEECRVIVWCGEKCGVALLRRLLHKLGDAVALSSPVS